MHLVPELVESVWDFRLEKVNSGVPHGYFAAKEEVMHQRYFILNDFAGECKFFATFSKIPRRPRLFCEKRHKSFLSLLSSHSQRTKSSHLRRLANYGASFSTRELSTLTSSTEAEELRGAGQEKSS